MSFALGLGAAVESGFAGYDYVKNKQKDKRKEEREAERHGLFVGSTKQQMGLRDTQEQRAGETHTRALRDSDEAYGRAQADNAERRSQADNRATAAELGLEGARAQNAARRAQAGAAGERQRLYQTQRSLANLELELKTELQEDTAEIARLTKAGQLDDAARLSEQSSARMMANRGDFFVEWYRLANQDGREAAKRLRQMPFGFDTAADVIIEDGKVKVIDKDRQVVNGVDRRGNPMPGERDVSEFENMIERRASQRIRDMEPDAKGRIFSIKQDELVPRTRDELREEYDLYKEEKGEGAHDYDTWYSRNYRSGRQQAKVEAEQDKTRRATSQLEKRFKTLTTQGQKPKKVPEGVSLVFFDRSAVHPADPSYPAWLAGDYANVKPDAKFLPRYTGMKGKKQVELL